ncbi:MAG: sulfatase, partial [Planctomycetota bacterium]
MKVMTGLLIVLCTFISLPQAAVAGQKPNFVIILIDDLGWTDLGCFGSTFYESPNVDALAAAGMKFTDGYAACPVCSPTRVAILTGKYPARLNLNDAFMCHRENRYSPILPAERRDDMPLEVVTIAEVLKTAGYTTAHVGKWHLGRGPYYPEHQGFDVNIGGNKHGMTRDFFWPGWRPFLPRLVGNKEGEYLPERLAAEAVKFIESNKDKQFFLNLCHYLVHIPIQAKKDTIAKYKAKPKRGNHNDPIYAAMIESMDQSVGRIMETLRRLNIDEKTVIFFTSDNGGLATRDGGFRAPTLNTPLRGGKGQLFEGGIRVPWIVKWPNTVKPGSVCNVPISSTDIFPTIMEMAGITDARTKGPIDGESMVPLLKQSG